MVQRLSPAERMVLSTAPNVASMLAVVRAARREVARPGESRAPRLGFADMLRYTFLVGFHRQPIFFTVGPVVAAICYIIVLIQIFI